MWAWMDHSPSLLSPLSSFRTSSLFSLSSLDCSQENLKLPDDEVIFPLFLFFDLSFSLSSSLAPSLVADCRCGRRAAQTTPDNSAECCTLLSFGQAVSMHACMHAGERGGVDALFLKRALPFSTLPPHAPKAVHRWLCMNAYIYTTESPVLMILDLNAPA